MARPVKRPTLDFSLGYDLTVCAFEHTLGSVLAAWSLLGILCLSLSLPLPCSFSLKRNKERKSINKKKRIKQNNPPMA